MAQRLREADGHLKSAGGGTILAERLSARCFEQSVVNDDLDVAYAELKALVLAALRDA